MHAFIEGIEIPRAAENRVNIFHLICEQVTASNPSIERTIEACNYIIFCLICTKILKEIIVVRNFSSQQPIRQHVVQRSIPDHSMACAMNNLIYLAWKLKAN